MTVNRRFVSPVTLGIRAVLALARRRALYEEKDDAAFRRQLADAAARNAAFGEGLRRIRGCSAEFRTAGGLNTLWVNGAADAPGRPLIVYLHGGGFLYRPGRLQRRMLAVLAKRLGATAAAPLYPLLPVGCAETALEALEIWYSAVCTGRTGPVYLIGDSAGGGLALSFALRCRDRGLPRAAAIALFSPWADLTLSSPEIPRLASHDPVLATAGLRRLGKLWAGDLPLVSPDVSPALGDLVGLPPTAVFAGTHELLLPDARTVCENMLAAGGEATFFRYAGQDHVFACYLTPEGMFARAEAARFLAAHGKNNVYVCQ